MSVSTNNRAISTLAPLLLWASAAAAQEQPEASSEVPVVGLPCEGCEAVFEGLPDSLSSVARLAPEDEPGEPMRIEGTVYDIDGRRARGVIVYAYHTDAQGIYPEDDRFGEWARRHGRLRGWALTDEGGHYRFETIRPVSYPDREIPAHVHMHVIEPGRCTYYLDSIHFADDPLLSEDERAELAEGRGGSGLLQPSRDEEGVWTVNRDIVLGLNVPGYSSCDE